MKILIYIITLSLLVSCTKNHEATDKSQKSSSIPQHNIIEFPTSPGSLFYITQSNFVLQKSTSSHTSTDPFSDDAIESSTNGSASDDPFALELHNNIPPALDQLFTKIVRVLPPNSKNSSPSDICYDLTKTLSNKGLKTQPSDWIILNQTRNTITARTSAENQRLLRENLEYHTYRSKIYSIQIQEITIPHSDQPTPETIDQLTARTEHKIVRTASGVIKQDELSRLKIPKLNPFKHPDLTVEFTLHFKDGEHTPTLSITYDTPTHTLYTKTKITQGNPLILNLTPTKKNSRDHFLIIHSNQIRP